MTQYKYAYCTDVGIRKKVNQDSFLLRDARLLDQEVCMAVICDGMGGLKKGELASASLIRAMDDWFTRDFLSTGLQIEEIKKQLNELIQRGNRKLWNYGEENGIQLGTTLTGLLLIYNEKETRYLIVHVGDSRCYDLSTDMSIKQLTEDQSLVAREVKRGNLTPEQAETDPRRNVLLQCIGASKIVEPVFYEGLVRGTSPLFLLCSDGFRHKISDLEIEESIKEALKELRKETCFETDVNQDGPTVKLAPLIRKAEIELVEDVENDIPHLNEALRKLVNLNMERGETDNITAIAVSLQI